jgi:hypothetical protein
LELEPVRLWASSPPRWLTIKAPAEIDRTLPAKLGRGKVEAISLANEHVETPYVSDAAMLSSLMEEKGVRQADIIRDTGISKTVLSLVLNGKRELTRQHIGTHRSTLNWTWPSSWGRLNPARSTRRAVLDHRDLVAGLVKVHLVHEGPDQEQAAAADAVQVFGLDATVEDRRVESRSVVVDDEPG